MDEANGYGIYSRERTAPLEDAQMTFNTTAEMVEYTGTMYGIADDCLNYIWNLIRYNVEEDEYAVILEEQREWKLREM